VGTTIGSDSGRENSDTPLPMVVVDRSLPPGPAPWALRRVLGVLLVGGATLVGLAWGGVRRLPAASAPPAASAARPARVAVGLGKVLPWSDVITVAPPFGAGDARIASLEVHEGDRVEKGSVLAVLDNERALLATVASAKAQIRAREAALAQVAASVSASRKESRMLLERTKVVAERASRELDRTEALHKDGAVSEQSFDLQRSASDEAWKEVARVKASLSRYGAGSVHGQADVVAAARQVDTARADLDRAEADLEKAYVRAPMAGTVLTIHGRPGERPASTGVLNLGDLERMKVEVEVYQTQIGQVSVGATVECEAEALPQRLQGVVQRVGLEVGRQTLVDMTPAASTDARVVKVTVALDEASTRLARPFSNLQVTARIASRGGS
jgi:HlyD family secretion protein